MTLDVEDDFFDLDEDEPGIEVTWTQEMWVLDPGPFIDIAFLQGVDTFVFRAKLHESGSMRQDWTKFIIGSARGRAWRAIWVPYPGDFAVLFTSEWGFTVPQAVWPIWRADRDAWIDLHRLIETPWSDDPSAARGYYGVDSRTAAEPVYALPGQEHRILVTGFPRSNDWGRIAMQILHLTAHEMKPVFHFHGQKSIARSVGMRVPAFDHPVRLGWYDGEPLLLLPNGQTSHISRLDIDKAMWLKIVGMMPKDFNTSDRTELARRVYDLNLRSLKWAYLNYDKAWDFRRKGRSGPGDDPEVVPTPTKVKFIRTKRLKDRESDLDKWLCDTCIYQDTCPYSREGAVCILPDTDGAELAARFKTRNANQIVDALGVIMSFQTKRLVTAAEKEREALDEKGELNDAVTRLANSIFDRGVQLAKLVDPVLGSRLAPKLNIGQFNLTGQGMTPQALTAGLAAQLAEQGIDLGSLDEDELGAVLAGIIDTTTGEEHADADAPADDR